MIGDDVKNYRWPEQVKPARAEMRGVTSSVEAPRYLSQKGSSIKRTIKAWGNKWGVPGYLYAGELESWWGWCAMGLRVLEGVLALQAVGLFKRECGKMWGELFYLYEGRGRLWPWGFWGAAARPVHICWAGSWETIAGRADFLLDWAVVLQPINWNIYPRLLYINPY